MLRREAGGWPVLSASGMDSGTERGTGHMELTHRKGAIPSGGDYGEQNLPSEFLPIQDKGQHASRSGNGRKKTNGN